MNERGVLVTLKQGNPPVSMANEEGKEDCHQIDSNVQASHFTLT